MKRLTVLFGFITIASWTGQALACGHTTIDYCGPELIQMLYATASGVIYIEPSSSWSGVVCSPVSGKYAILDPSTSNFRELYALLLSAKLSGSEVQLVMNGNQSTCTISYVTLN